MAIPNGKLEDLHVGDSGEESDDYDDPEDEGNEERGGYEDEEEEEEEESSDEGHGNGGLTALLLGDGTHAAKKEEEEEEDGDPEYTEEGIAEYPASLTTAASTGTKKRSLDESNEDEAKGAEDISTELAEKEAKKAKV